MENPEAGSGYRGRYIIHDTCPKGTIEHRGVPKLNTGFGHRPQIPTALLVHVTESSLRYLQTPCICNGDQDFNI